MVLVISPESLYTWFSYFVTGVVVSSVVVMLIITTFNIIFLCCYWQSGAPVEVPVLPFLRVPHRSSYLVIQVPSLRIIDRNLVGLLVVAVAISCSSSSSTTSRT